MLDKVTLMASIAMQARLAYFSLFSTLKLISFAKTELKM